MDNQLTSFKEIYIDFISQITPRIYDLHINGENITAKVTRQNLHNFLIFLKYDYLHQLKLCLDITAYDTPGKIFRFSIIYSLLSTEYNSRYQVYTQTDPYLGLETITSIYSSAN
jgi:NADH:ubiquinone oxidoreductase subunit C